MAGVHLYSIAIPQDLWQKVKDLKIVTRQVMIQALVREVQKQEKGNDDGNGQAGA
jgi:hypothetical protein